MNRFEWVEAGTVTQAMAASNADSSFKAGGVDLLDLMKDNLLSPKRLVNIRTVEGLGEIGEDERGLHIGPLVTLTEIEEHPVIQKKYPSISEAAFRVVTPQIRNMGTIGGNLVQRPRCWYFRSADFHCRKKGGEVCFALQGENQLHAIAGNGVCAIVHPSSIATALVAYGATVKLKGRS